MYIILKSGWSSGSVLRTDSTSLGVRPILYIVEMAGYGSNVGHFDHQAKAGPENKSLIT